MGWPVTGVLHNICCNYNSSTRRTVWECGELSTALKDTEANPMVVLPLRCCTGRKRRQHLWRTVICILLDSRLGVHLYFHTMLPPWALPQSTSKPSIPGLTGSGHTDAAPATLTSLRSCLGVAVPGPFATTRLCVPPFQFQSAEIWHRHPLCYAVVRRKLDCGCGPTLKFTVKQRLLLCCKKTSARLHKADKMLRGFQSSQSMPHSASPDP